MNRDFNGLRNYKKKMRTTPLKWFASKKRESLGQFKMNFSVFRI
jgi:hypothetical protein